MRFGSAPVSIMNTHGFFTSADSIVITGSWGGFRGKVFAIVIRSFLVLMSLFVGCPVLLFSFRRGSADDGRDLSFPEHSFIARRLHS